MASLAAIFGLVLGRLWDSRLETVRWRRDQCVRVYGQVTSAYYDVREALRVLALTEPDTPESEAAENRIRTVGAEWDGCMVAVWVHGSEPVAKAIRQVDQEVERLLNRIRSYRLTWEEFWEERRPAGRALDAFIEEIRKELKRPLIQVRVTTT
jgi:GTP cyclohydrolase II